MSDKPPTGSPESTTTSEGDASHRHLLAVDLGLRTGLALYGPDGRLVSYRSKHFSSNAELRRGAASIIDGHPGLGWSWLEGGGYLGVIWEKHASFRDIRFNQIQAEDWRRGLMLPRQQRSGDRAKREADGLARKIIDWSGAPKPRGALKHDAAEAILIGLHGALRVGLLERPPRLA
mgnify:CR=1 FL=1